MVNAYPPRYETRSKALVGQRHESGHPPQRTTPQAMPAGSLHFRPTNSQLRQLAHYKSYQDAQQLMMTSCMRMTQNRPSSPSTRDDDSAMNTEETMLVVPSSEPFEPPAPVVHTSIPLPAVSQGPDVPEPKLAESNPLLASLLYYGSKLREESVAVSSNQQSPAQNSSLGLTHSASPVTYPTLLQPSPRVPITQLPNTEEVSSSSVLFLGTSFADGEAPVASTSTSKYSGLVGQRPSEESLQVLPPRAARSASSSKSLALPGAKSRKSSGKQRATSNPNLPSFKNVFGAAAAKKALVVLSRRRPSGFEQRRLPVVVHFKVGEHVLVRRLNQCCPLGWSEWRRGVVVQVLSYRKYSNAKEATVLPECLVEYTDMEPGSSISTAKDSRGCYMYHLGEICRQDKHTPLITTQQCEDWVLFLEDSM